MALPGKWSTNEEDGLEPTPDRNVLPVSLPLSQVVRGWYPSSKGRITKQGERSRNSTQKDSSGNVHTCGLRQNRTAAGRQRGPEWAERTPRRHQPESSRNDRLPVYSLERIYVCVSYDTGRWRERGAKEISRCSLTKSIRRKER